MDSSSDNLVVAIALFIFALPLGSFLNVVAYRLPRGQTPWNPKRSHCPSCDAQLSPRDNLPVVGWLLLRGKCRSCGEKISWRYPFFEALTAVLFFLVGLKFGWEIQLLPPLLLVVTLVTISNSDLDMRVIPNAVLFCSLLAGLIAMSLAYPDEWVTWAASAAIAFGVFFLIALVYPRGMGMGDVKLAGVMGLYLGRAVAPSLLFAFAAGALVGVAVMARAGVEDGRKTAIPFGPFMAAGGILGIFYGETVVQWYLDTFVSSS
jgi:leader peptidase (prepilin peptidase) / N-methyltransferase